MSRRINGEGTIFKRKDGRWSAQAYVTLPSGERKRICMTAKNREEVKTKLCEVQEREKRRIPYCDRNWSVAEYLDYWLTKVQPDRVRETTIAFYENIVRNYIKPTIGRRKLRDLSIFDVRGALDALKERSCSGRTGQKYLQTLSACLQNAMREELIHRNVARLVEKPKYTAKETAIWTAEQTSRFLAETRNHPQHAAFLLLFTYGMRRGEVLGLRWSDIDFNNNLFVIRQQIDRINGEIKARDVKTVNSRRTLPLMANVRAALREHAFRNGVTPTDFDPARPVTTDGTVIASRKGTPLEPRNLTRCFDILTAKCGLPRIKIHAARHVAATVLKDLNVPIKDVQLILGHSNISTTMNIYQHGTEETRRAAVFAIEERLFRNKTASSVKIAC
jgi:integrase